MKSTTEPPSARGPSPARSLTMTSQDSSRDIGKSKPDFRHSAKRCCQRIHRDHVQPRTPTPRVRGSSTGVRQGSWFSGLQERSIFIESLEGTHLVSIRLHPLGATQLLGADAPRAANSIVDLETFIGADARELRDTAGSGISRRDSPFSKTCRRTIADRNPTIRPRRGRAHRNVSWISSCRRSPPRARRQQKAPRCLLRSLRRCREHDRMCQKICARSGRAARGGWVTNPRLLQRVDSTH